VFVSTAMIVLYTKAGNIAALKAFWTTLCLYVYMWKCN